MNRAPEWEWKLYGYQSKLNIYLLQMNMKISLLDIFQTFNGEPYDKPIKS